MKNNSTKNKTVKFISALLIIAMITPTVLFSRPRQANAIIGIGDTVYDAANHVESLFTAVSTAETAVATGATAASSATTAAWTVKDWVLRMGEEFLKLAAKALLAKMTQATIDWINSDFHGSPLFLENPSSFFNDIAKSELKNIVNTFGYDSLLYPFGKQFALNAINSYKSRLADNAGYTLSKVMNGAELERYRNDFNFGGWNGFLINTQYPQNNYVGFQMIATEELARRIQGTSQSAADKVKTTLDQGMGFLSPQTCPSNKDYNNGTNEFQRPSFDSSSIPYPCGEYDATDENQTAYLQCKKDWDRTRDATKAKWEKTNTCPGGLVNTTPGSVAANQIFTAMGTPFLQTALDGALGNSIAAIFDALIMNFINKGLNALSSAVSGTPPVDNWSYDGNTLDGSYYDTSEDGDLNIPQNVSITAGQTTSTTISGGSKYYSIQIYPNASIATAKIDTSGSVPKLSISGVTPGTTSVTIQDSYNLNKAVTVTITVSAVGALMVAPAKILTDINSQIVATISGGAEPYSFQKGPNESIAIAMLAGPNLIVSGFADGATFVDIKDSSEPVKTIRVKIVIGPDVLLLTPSSISMLTNEMASLSISNGSILPYHITSQQNTNVANAEIRPATPNTLNITSYAAGTSLVTVEDSSIPAKTATVEIVVNPRLAIDPSGISIYTGETTNLSILNGKLLFSITDQQDTSVANATIQLPSTLSITAGSKAGISIVTIKDSSEPAQTATATITVMESVNY